MKTVRALLLSGTLALSGCAGISNPITGNPLTAADVQNAAVAACGFLPTISTVTAIIATVAGVAGPVASAASVASQICAAVLPVKSAMKAGRRGGVVPTVNGVTVHGRFIR